MTHFFNFLIIFYIRVVKFACRILLKSVPKFNCRHLLETNYKLGSNFSFLQVGANDGKSFDTLYEFVTLRNSKGLVIEPIKEYFDELSFNYINFPHIQPLNVAVHESLGQVSLFKLKKSALIKYPEWAKGIASFDLEHLNKNNIDIEDIEEVLVRSDNLMAIAEDHLSDFNIDYFQVDAEGYDYFILQMLDFTRLRPRILKYENSNLTIQQVQLCEELLRKNKYYLFNDYNDTIAVDLERINLF